MELRSMAGTTQERNALAVEVAHYWSGGDGGAALESLVEGFGEGNREIPLTDTPYDNQRLQVKSRILKETPPEVWAGWPGGELRGYVDAGTAKDVTDLWDRNDLERHFRPFAADSVRIDDRYHAIPLSIHRVNDLYLNASVVESTGVDPATASDPEEFVELLAQAADVEDVSSVLVPMADPFVVLQLWEVTLLGLAGPRTYDAVVDGNPARNRDAIRSALDCVARMAEYAPTNSLYHGLGDANDQFVAGRALAYPQGDWAAGYFQATEGFTFESDWNRVAFPGTEGQYDLVMDAFVPSQLASGDGIDAFLEYAASPDAQERFNRLKGSIPPRSDVSMDSFGAFARDQERTLDRSTEQPRSVAHGLSVTPTQVVDLKSVVAEFVDTWDVETATDRMVAAFDDE